MLVFEVSHLGVTKLPTPKTSQALHCIFLFTNCNLQWKPKAHCCVTLVFAVSHSGVLNSPHQKLRKQKPKAHCFVTVVLKISI